MSIDPEDQSIPKEILESEARRGLPEPPAGPSFLGMPGIPGDIIAIAVKYGHWLVLAASVSSGFSAFSMLVANTGAGQPYSPTLPFSSLCMLASSAIGFVAFFWMMQKRRLGWYAAVAMVALQFLSQLVMSGGASILGGGFELIIGGYILAQMRESYTED